MDCYASRPAFITIKDHKLNFWSNTKCILINSAKNELGLMSKKHLENIIANVPNTIKVNQWRNTTTVIDWFNPSWDWLFWKSQGWGEPSRPAVKKHAVSQKIFVYFTLNFVHILYWQYGISLDKKIGKCHFCHHLITSSWKSCAGVF